MCYVVRVYMGVKSWVQQQQQQEARGSEAADLSLTPCVVFVPGR